MLMLYLGVTIQERKEQRMRIVIACNDPDFSFKQGELIINDISGSIYIPDVGLPGIIGPGIEVDLTEIITSILKEAAIKAFGSEMD